MADFVYCSECMFWDDCYHKENRDGCYFGETEEKSPPDLKKDLIFMLKQYRLTREYKFKQTLELYHDGELVSSRTLWADEREDAIEKLEAEGYTYGYTTIEIHRQKKIYELMLEAAIPGR